WAGHTYTGTAEQFADYPVISAPTPGESWHLNVPNNLRADLGTMTVSIPGAGIRSLGPMVADARDPDGRLVSPAGHDLFELPAAGTVTNDPLTPGNRVVIVGKLATFNGVGGADGRSLLLIGALTGEPIVVSSGTLASLAITPSDPGFPFIHGRA